jgi:Cd2+/Zn2+-exporting ATPase
MTVVTTGAFVLGEFHEVVAIMAFYELGEYLQIKAVRHSKDIN